MTDLQLTTAESQCLALRMEGMSTDKIAAALALSPRTVETHFYNAQKRNGCANGFQLVALLATQLESARGAKQRNQASTESSIAGGRSAA